MTDFTLDELRAIHTLGSYKEIQGLEGFKTTNPLSTDNFADIYGDYWLEPKVKCCRSMPEGGLCGKEHNFGFVAILKDGSLTLVGNCCAQTKFGALSNVKKARDKFMKLKEQKDAFQNLRELLTQKQERAHALSVLLKRTIAVESRAKGFFGSLGPMTLARLQSKARSGDANIRIEVITDRHYTDVQGNPAVEAIAVPIVLGTLFGLSIVNFGSYANAIKSQISRIAAALNTADLIPETAPRHKLVEAAVAINEASQLVVAVESFEKSEDAFFSGSLWLLCFVVPDRQERYRTAKAVLHLRGEQSGKDKAKAFVAGYEQRIKAENRADRIRM